MSIKTLKAPGYGDEELAQLVTDLLVLKKAQIQDFLGQNKLRKSGTKAEFREWIEEALRDGDLAPECIFQFLGAVIPWGKQHVYLYTGPGGVRSQIGRSPTGSPTSSNNTELATTSMLRSPSHCPRL